MKSIRSGKEVKLKSFVDDIIPYIKYPQVSTKKKKLLDLINEFDKVSGYKLNIQKSVVSPYTNNDLSEREI